MKIKDLKVGQNIRWRTAGNIHGTGIIVDTDYYTKLFGFPVRIAPCIDSDGTEYPDGILSADEIVEVLP